LIFKFKI